MQRALTQVFALRENQLGSPSSQMEVVVEARYINDLSVAATTTTFFVRLAIDTSVRQIVDSVIAETIAQQPAGFSLQDKDVILVGLERG